MQTNRTTGRPRSHSWDISTFHDDTIEIPLTRGKVAIIDAADADLVLPYKWHTTGDGCYAATNAGGYRRMHTLIMGTPAGVEVDHEDGDGFNNRRSNLRLATHQQNTQNKTRYASNTSGHRWVSWCRRNGKWLVRVQRKHIGYFDLLDDAVLAANEAAAHRYGAFKPT